MGLCADKVWKQVWVFGDFQIHLLIRNSDVWGPTVLHQLGEINIIDVTREGKVTEDQPNLS